MKRAVRPERVERNIPGDLYPRYAEFIQRRGRSPEDRRFGELASDSG